MVSLNWRYRGNALIQDAVGPKHRTRAYVEECLRLELHGKGLPQQRRRIPRDFTENETFQAVQELLPSWR
jgi:hypothetical protein